MCIGEGEETFADLLNQVDGGKPDFSKVDGIAHSQDGTFHRTPPRKLVRNLDDLPLPAYDMMPMHLYGKSRYLFSPGGTTIHHSRGCTSSCSFCAWFTHNTSIGERSETVDMHSLEHKFPEQPLRD